MAIAHVASTILTNAGSGSAASVSAIHDFAAARIDGLWLYTKVTSSGFTSAPTGGFPRLRTVVCPQASSGVTMADDGIMPMSFENSTPADGAYTFANYWPGQPPRYATVKVQNLTGVSLEDGVLSVAVEYIKET